MFTGLIEDTGQIKSLKKRSTVYLLCVKAFRPDFLIGRGDSVAVNGVCLTAVNSSKGLMYFEVMDRTFKNTNICFAKKGDLVNLEKALSFGGRLGGHFVQGHVDSAVSIKKINRKKDGLEFKLNLPRKNSFFVIPMGSVALDGISLTVQEVTKESFSVYIIPHTFKNTNLKKRNIGDRLNLEIDILAKYAASRDKPSSFDINFLRKNGF